MPLEERMREAYASLKAPEGKFAVFAWILQIRKKAFQYRLANHMGWKDLL